MPEALNYNRLQRLAWLKPTSSSGAALTFRSIDSRSVDNRSEPAGGNTLELADGSMLRP